MRSYSPKTMAETFQEQLIRLEQRFIDNLRFLDFTCHGPPMEYIIDEIHYLQRNSNRSIDTCRICQSSEYAYSYFGLLNQGLGEYMEHSILNIFHCGLIHQDHNVVKYTMENLMTENKAKSALFWPPLIIAVGVDDLNILNYLMDQNWFDPRETNLYGKEDAIDMAIATKNFRAFRILTKDITDINFKEEYEDRYIDKAASLGQVKIVKHILDRSKFNNSLDKIIGTELLEIPLVVAGQAGHLEIVELIIDYLLEKNPKSAFVYHFGEDKLLMLDLEKGDGFVFEDNIGETKFSPKVKEYFRENCYDFEEFHNEPMKVISSMLNFMN